MPFLAYKIENKINNKVYIGITTRALVSRKAEHFSPSQYKRKTRLYNAIRKHGVENFNIEHIASSTSLDNLLELEKQLILQFNSLVSGYNSTHGGDINKFTDETRAKISNTKMGHEVTQESREKISSKLRQSWKIIYPDGSEVITNNFRQYCKDNNLHYFSLAKTAPHYVDRRNSWFGFTCEKLSA